MLTRTTVAERRAALARRRPRWTPRTTAQLLDAAAAEHPDRPLLLTDGAPVTYEAMAGWSARLAAGLVARGVCPGDHVALDLPNGPEAVALRFAVARLGAVAVPLNTALRHAELRYSLHQSDSVLLVTVARFRDVDHLSELDRIAPGWATRPGRAGGDALPLLRDVVVVGPADRGVPLGALESWGVPATEVRRRTAAADPFAPSDLIYTSGTTGDAKGVLLTHDAVLRTAHASAHTRAFADGWRMLFALPLFHVFGYVEGLLAVMAVAGAVRMQDVFDADRMLADLGEHRIDELMCVPAMTTVVLERARHVAYDATSLRTVFSSGGAHPPGIWSALRAAFGAEECYTAYGQTETTASTVCTRPGDEEERLSGTNGTGKPAGVAGEPGLGGTLAEYSVIDPDTGAHLGRGVRGELVVRGPIVTRGYYQKPAETAAAFTADGWFRTGDLGLLDEQGYLVLTGRRKESYRCGGELVLPGEVERTLAAHPGVAEAHVVGLPDDRMGEVGCAWIVPRDPTAPPTAAEIVDFCRDRLARFKVPRTVQFSSAEDLPRTATARVQKFVLVERALSRTARAAPA
ncbi:class I adenylate-forming enzyme family protein [Pseudonocardia sp. NPDC049154]|uniref:class I adenylate-forming enzyme family protein n=1 Tax=Pseudonocardia sp. NPDC049154 TaxID=3155501 RepID=UPI003400C6E5